MTWKVTQLDRTTSRAEQPENVKANISRSVLSLVFAGLAWSPHKIPPACQENVKPQQRRQSVSQPAVLHSVSLWSAVEPPYVTLIHWYWWCCWYWWWRLIQQIFCKIVIPIKTLGERERETSQLSPRQPVKLGGPNCLYLEWEPPAKIISYTDRSGGLCMCGVGLVLGWLIKIIL